MVQRFDYTQERKGKKTRDGAIVICPRCGRKGARKEYPAQGGRKAMVTISHGGYDDFFHTIDQHCIIVQDTTDGTAVTR